MPNNYMYQTNCLQYFRIKPSEMILNKILECFEMKGICCYTRLSIIHCDSVNVINNFIKIKLDLGKYYRPQKIEALFETTPLTFQNCITILKNVVSFFNYNVRRREYKINHQQRFIYYQIENNADFTIEQKKIPIRINRSESILVEFK